MARLFAQARPRPLSFLASLTARTRRHRPARHWLRAARGIILVLPLLLTACDMPLLKSASPAPGAPGQSSAPASTTSDAVLGASDDPAPPSHGVLAVRSQTADTLLATSSQSSGKPLPSATLTASPGTIAQGGSSTLSWKTAGATSVTLNGTAVAKQGSQAVSPPQTATYVLVATNSAGSTTQSATVTVVASAGATTTQATPAPTASLSASPTSISSGQPSTLTWSTTNATVVTLNGSSVPASGSLSVLPQTTTTYTLVAQNSAGSATASATVTVTSTSTSTTSSTSTTTTASTATTAAGTRDPALWPFAATSPWNYPIGSAAQYATIVKGDGTTGFTRAYFNAGQFTFGVWIASTSDPLRNIVRDDRQSNGGPTYVYSANTFPRQVPAGMVAAPGEGQLIVITTDHLTAMELYGAYQDANGNWHGPAGMSNVNLKGPGWGEPEGIWYSAGQEAMPQPATSVASGTALDGDGCTTAACLTGLGGLIRPGELRNGIPHALAFATEPYYWNRNAPGGRSFVWPAVSSDDPTPYGTQGNLYFGGLVAIPASVDVNSLGLQTTEGKNVALALQRYGAYARDTADTGPNTLVFYMDYAARGELPTSAAFASDMAIIARHLMVVANSHDNGRKPIAPSVKVQAPGGDGTLLAPLAPPFGK